MGWNDAYWIGKEERAKKAKAHHEMAKDKYYSEFVHSVINTEVWDDKQVEETTYIENIGTPVISVVNKDTVSAILSIPKDKKIAILNFASYKTPGGGFLSGSGAQEESLCHESSLYEVISHQTFIPFYDWNNHHKNKALYTNRGLYSPDIYFERDGQGRLADVITVAAPNNMAYMEYNNNADPAENERALRSRILFIKNIIKAHSELDAVILGAFGCGVFGQNPWLVAKIFKEAFSDMPIETIYAVIDKGGHSKEGAFAIFKQVLEE